MHQSFTKLTDERPLVHCKTCRGVLLVFRNKSIHSCKGSIEFDMRCPHCGKDWHLRMVADPVPIVELSDTEGKDRAQKK